ncbi:MAG: cytochrome C [Hyphomonadaceae bacterium]
MARFLSLLLLGLAASCAPSQPYAPDPVLAPGNASAGLRYAETTCARCHAVAAGAMQSPNPDAPPFEEIADLPGMTHTSLSVWLNTSHPTMPDLIVDASQVDNLSAYLESLVDAPR